MELELVSDVELLRATTARFIEATCPLTRVRELLDDPFGVPDGYTRAAADLGWYAMLVPEALGGGSVSGEGVADLAVIAEERGRGLQPGPFISMNVAAAALSHAGAAGPHADVVRSLASGEATATWVTADANGVWSPTGGVTAIAGGDGFRLSGRSSLVPDGYGADWLLVSAGGDGGASQFVVPSTAPGVVVEALASHDITQRYASVSFDDVNLPHSALVGVAGGAGPDIEDQLQLAVVLTVAETVGAMDVLFEMARTYAIDRTAFGRPIGSFQAVKHQLADLSLSLEAAKSISVAATRAVQAGQADAGELASMAKAWVGDAGIDIVQGCFQVFGGIGYTWEHNSHLFLRRITTNGLLFGQPDWHRERICTIHGL